MNNDIYSIDESESLEHYGTKRHSGRYEWGSGEDPYQHESWNWLKRDDALKDQGFTEKQRAEKMGCKNTTEYRNLRSRYSNEFKAGQITRAKHLVLEKQYSKTKAAEIMGINESTLRSLLKENREARVNLTNSTAELVKKQVDKDKFVDIGAGTEIALGVTKTRLKSAIAQLESEGYKKWYVTVNQMGTNHKTTLKVLAPPGVEYKDIIANKNNITPLGSSKIINDDGDILSIHNEPPKSVSSKRILVRYYEDGGIDKDGTIELRKGVDDISLGRAKYAQVRIAVDDTHYLKGMALHTNNIPEGYDIVFNTNKHKIDPVTGKPNDIHDVLKKMKEDPNNPFGASIKDNETDAMTQKYYIDKDGKRQLSAINVVNEEGDWDTWSKNLASQFLSKQAPSLAKRQLDKDISDKKEQFTEINQLTNKTIKKKLLESFANDCDAAAVHLKAAAFPGQKTHVILPFTTLKDNEVYAPNYEDGTEVVLVRYPHAGVFEIPKLVVRNNNKEAKSAIGNATDAIGINSKVAAQLSGADFDGDTAILIPLKNGVKIRTSGYLEELKDFDPKEAYPYREGMKIMTPQNKGKEMGKISNLITDMTLIGASDDEIARAVKHSMVVIDSEKHKLDYELSFKENDISSLKKKYQNGGGASTIISRAKSPIVIDARKERYGINKLNTDPETGKKIFEETGEVYNITKEYKNGTTKDIQKKATQKIPKMEYYDDARELISTGHYPIEEIYANYANQCKALANQARKEYLQTGNHKYLPSAKQTYASEVASLQTKLKTALSNAPKERQAQLLANQIYANTLASDPGMDEEHKKKAKGTALTLAREHVGARKERINITDREWEAIQAGAITENVLSTIIDNSDLDHIKKLATPRTSEVKLSDSKVALINAMSSQYTIAEIAERCGCSTSTVSKILNGKKGN